jgi:hypothetical protein
MREVTARLNSCPSLSSTASSCSLVPPSPHEPVDVLGTELLDEAVVGVELQDEVTVDTEQQGEVTVDAELLGGEQQDEALVGVELLGGDAVAVEVPMVAMNRRPMGKIRKLSITEEKIARCDDSTYPWVFLSYLTSHRVSRFVLHVLHFHPVQVHFPTLIAAEVDKSIVLHVLHFHPVKVHFPTLIAVEVDKSIFPNLSPAYAQPLSSSFSNLSTSPVYGSRQGRIGTAKEARRPRVQNLLP